MAEEKKAGGGKRWLIIIGGLLLVLLAGSNAYLLLRDSGNGGVGQADEPEPLPLADPIFVKVGPMTVNIPSDRQGERLLYTSVMIKVGDEATESFIKKYIPEVNDRLLGLLSQQSVEQLTARDGKARLAQEILVLLQRPFSERQPELSIESVLFQDFIVQ